MTNALYFFGFFKQIICADIGLAPTSTRSCFGPPSSSLRPPHHAPYILGATESANLLSFLLYGGTDATEKTSNSPCVLLTRQKSAMATPLRRGKILDVALSALFLVVFGLVPVILLRTQPSRQFQVEKIQTAYTAAVILSWPFFVIGGALLLFFWKKDRSIDKTHFTTATPAQLSVMSMALISAFLGCLLLFSAVLLATINRFQRDDGKVYVVIDIISMVLIGWIAYLMLSVISEIWRLRKSLREFSQNQAFPEAQQHQTAHANEASHAPQQDSAEPTFV